MPAILCEASRGQKLAEGTARIKCNDPGFFLESVTISSKKGRAMDNVIIPKPHEAVASLAEIAAQVNAAHEGVEAASRAAVCHARRAGDLLLKAKARVQHGYWRTWLQTHFKGSHQKAERYMRIARHWNEIVARGGEDLGVRDALSLIAQKEDAEEGSKASPVTLLNPVAGDSDRATSPEEECIHLQGFWSRRHGTNQAHSH
jgi:Protein of unknown function (DUF3102)